MGRKKIENPTRMEKEKFRKRRIQLLSRAKKIVKEDNTDVYIVLRRYGTHYVYNSKGTADWLPEIGKLDTVVVMDKDSPPPKEVEVDGAFEAKVLKDLALQNLESQHKTQYSTIWGEQHQKQCIVAAPFPLSMPPKLESSPVVVQETFYPFP